jgi:Tol biopolymer transport system component
MNYFKSVIKISLKLGWGLVVFLLITIYGFNVSSIALAEEPAKSIPGKLIFFAIDTSHQPGYYIISFDKTAKGIKPIINPYDNTLLPLRNKPELAKILEGVRTQSFSPDSTKILFTLSKRINRHHVRLSDIYILDIENGISYQLTSTGHNICPAWSPDGKKIAFYRGNEYPADFELYLPDAKGLALAVINSDGTNLKEIVSNGNLLSIYRDYPPQWSPSGNDLLFSYRVRSISFNTGIYLVHIDGTGLKLLKPNAERESWSPDGKKIIMEVYYEIEGSKIRGSKIQVLDSTGANETILVSEAKSNYRPVWSPDGKLVAFITSKHNIQTNISIISLDGQKYINIIPPELHIQTSCGLSWIP